MKTIQLKPKHDHRIRNGHRWIFSNEIHDSLKSYEPGESVKITDANGYPVGVGYINPYSLIAVRILSFKPVEINRHFFLERIRNAYERRQVFYADQSCYRVVFGESDDLPGLTIDRYGDYWVMQILTAGMDIHQDMIVDIIRSEFSPKAIILRNDSAVRKLEHLSEEVRVAHGDCPSMVEVTIQNLLFRLDLLHGQKTGFFLDQKENHAYVRRFTSGKRVLDCFTHLGGWAVHAALGGATEVIGLDISEAAIAQCRTHAEINQSTQCQFKCVDVFDELKAINDRRESFDVIILDPPAFAKSKSQVKEAIKGYREINRRAAKAIPSGGYLFTCSCSQAIDPDTFRNTVFQGVTAAGRQALLLEERTQPKDHPILMSMRETQYLKCLVIQII